MTDDKNNDKIKGEFTAKIISEKENKSKVAGKSIGGRGGKNSLLDKNGNFSVKHIVDTGKGKNNNTSHAKRILQERGQIKQSPVNKLTTTTHLTPPTNPLKKAVNPLKSNKGDKTKIPPNAKQSIKKIATKAANTKTVERPKIEMLKKANTPQKKTEIAKKTTQKKLQKADIKKVGKISKIKAVTQKSVTTPLKKVGTQIMKTAKKVAASIPKKSAKTTKKAPPSRGRGK